MSDPAETIRERWAKATPGPWESFSHLADIAHRVKGPPYTRALPRCEGGYRWYARAEDAEAIAHAPSDIAYMLAELSGLRAERDALRERLDDLIEWTADLRAKARDAASFWDEFVGPSEKGHPSDELFAELAAEMDVDESLVEARRALAGEEPPTMISLRGAATQPHGQKNTKEYLAILEPSGDDPQPDVDDLETVVALASALISRDDANGCWPADPSARAAVKRVKQYAAALRVGPSPQPEGETDAILMATQTWEARDGGNPPPVVYSITRRAYEMGRLSVRVPPSEPSDQAIDAAWRALPYTMNPLHQHIAAMLRAAYAAQFGAAQCSGAHPSDDVS